MHQTGYISFVVRASRARALAEDPPFGGLWCDQPAPFFPLSTARRGWVTLPATLTQNNDDSLVDECERGEDHALEVYRNALDDHLPEFVRQVVLRQFEGLMSDHDQIRVLRSDPLQGGTVAASTGGHARQ